MIQFSLERAIAACSIEIMKLIKLITKAYVVNGKIEAEEGKKRREGKE
jgi:hypothetical protein